MIKMTDNDRELRIGQKTHKFFRELIKDEGLTPDEMISIAEAMKVKVGFYKLAQAFEPDEDVEKVTFEELFGE